MHFLDVLSECPAQGRLHVERKRMIAGGATLYQTVSDKVRWESKPRHAMDLDETWA
jgi:hypothetical protein